MCFCEPTQLVYAGVGIELHIVATALSGFQSSSWRGRLAESALSLKQRLACVGIPMLACIAGSLLIYAANGMLPRLWAFERSIGDQGNYGALPANIDIWVLPALQPDTVFLLVFLLAGYTVYRWARMKGQSDRLGAILVVLSGTAFAAMQKKVCAPCR